MKLTHIDNLNDEIVEIWNDTIVWAFTVDEVSESDPLPFSFSSKATAESSECRAYSELIADGTYKEGSVLIYPIERQCIFRDEEHLPISVENCYYIEISEDYIVAKNEFGMWKFKRIIDE